MYRIIVKKKAKKFIDKLPVNERERIVHAIEQLPNGEDIKKIKGNVLDKIKYMLYYLRRELNWSRK